MCIRDRCRLRQHRRFDIDEAIVVEEAAEGAGSFVAQHQVCLLYTSEAADERSSVDLGGRRIIKKKNKRTNVEEAE